jgi:hypothetical protein
MAFMTVILLTGCPGKEPEYIDLGTIPEKYLATVPYEDGQTFYLQHESDRVVIPFHVTRHRTKAQGDNASGFNDYGMKFQPSPSVYFDYEVDVTTCKPDYPIFDIDIRFSNAYVADSVYYQNYDPLSPKHANFAALNLFATFPFIGEPTDQFTVLDSLEVNGHIYYNVFELVNEYQDQEEMYAKAAYYNYEKGVIAIYMSNGENYLLYEEE